MTNGREIQAVVDGDQREEAWKLYLQSFDELRYLAVQRHVMYGEEFDAVMADPLVDKFLVWGDDGSLQGLSTMTATCARCRWCRRSTSSAAGRSATRPGWSSTSASSACTRTATARGCSATWCGP